MLIDSDIGSNIHGPCSWEYCSPAVGALGARKVRVVEGFDVNLMPGSLHCKGGGGVVIVLRAHHNSHKPFISDRLHFYCWEAHILYEKFAVRDSYCSAFATAFLVCVKLMPPALPTHTQTHTIIEKFTPIWMDLCRINPSSCQSKLTKWCH